MFGPVFEQEIMLANRRGRRVLFRRLYTGWLLLQFGGLLFLHFVEVAVARSNDTLPTPFSARAEPVQRWLLLEQFLLVFLATPAFTAGAITDEKTRGTLQYLLAAGLTSWEILVGKLFGRAANVASMALAALPLLAFLGVFTGIGPGLLSLLVAALATPLLAAGAAGLLASVWCRSTRDAVLAVYLSGSLTLALVWSLGVLSWFDPFAALGSGLPQEELAFGELAFHLFRSAFLWGMLALGCVGVASWRLRAAYFKQLASVKTSNATRWWQVVRPPVGENPLTWKERWIDGVAPLAALRAFPRWLGMLVVFVGTLAGFASSLWNVRGTEVTLQTLLRHATTLDLEAMQGCFLDPASAVTSPNLWMIFLATLLVGARASSTVTGERERQSWEGLLLTPLTVREVLRGKLWGIIGATYPYLGAYALAALPVSLLGGPWAFLITLGALGGAWLAMWVLGSAGIWSSVKSRSSWRSLVSTLFFGYAATILFQGVFMAVVSVAILLIFLLLSLFDWRFGTGFAGNFMGNSQGFMVMSYLALGGVFLVLPWWFFNSAQRHIAFQERTRRWPGKRKIEGQTPNEATKERSSPAQHLKG